jgi:hypothetical protein
MATTPDEAMADAASKGAEVELGCSQCAETWIVFVHHGEDVTSDQAECPIAGCPGEGEVV